jgi:hypothetical protein
MASIFDGFQTNPVVIRFRESLTSGEFKEFPIDVTKAINTTMSAQVTKFPVEGGGQITDHVQVEPLSMSLDCLISESPSQQLLTIASSIASGVINSTGAFQGLSGTFASAAASSAVSDLAGAIGLQGGKSANYSRLLTERRANDPDFPKRALKGLISMLENGVPFTIRTFFTEDIYQNMLITSLNFSQTPAEGGSLAFTMNCEKITVVKAFSRTPSELRMADPAGSSAAAALQLGGQTPKSTDTGPGRLYKNFGPGSS